jgi:hypothetical protein
VREIVEADVRQPGLLEQATPTPTMRGPEAQVNGRRYGTVGGEDGVGELEERAAPRT